MSSLPRYSSTSAILLGLGLAISSAAPIVISAPAIAANFVDIQSNWARPFIEALADENIVSGYSDRTFRPDQPVTRAQFAAMVQQAFDENNIQLPQGFDQAAAEYWSSRDLSSGRASNRQLRSSDRLSRAQVLVALTNGLGLSATGATANTLNIYTDAAAIPEYARNSVAAATQKGLVVNYPDVTKFNPTQTATRADVTAFIYQALVNEGVLAPISSRLPASNYIVRLNTGTNRTANNRTNNQTTTNNRNTQTPQYKVARGTAIQVEYPYSNQLIVTPGETVDVTLTVAEDIKNSRGEILIPKNSEIEGQIVPRYSGSTFLGVQFVAQRLITNNESYNNINATSSLITGQQQTSTSTTNGRQTVGDTALRILTGVLTGRTQPQQQPTRNTSIVVNPETDLRLTLGSDFYVNTLTQAPRR